MFFITISTLLGFTQVPIVSATSTSNPSIFEILSSGDITFIGGGSTTKMIVVGPPSFIFPAGGDARVDGTSLWFGAATLTKAWAPVEIPDGATITGFECIVLHGSDNKDMLCALLEHQHGALSTTLISNLISTVITGTPQTITNTDPISYPVDRDSNDYQVRFNTLGCTGQLCAIISAKITYTVPSGFVVGGEFYPVDNVSLILAYGLVNSWWMAPIGIGIGLGIYLVKRKIE